MSGSELRRTRILIGQNVDLIKSEVKAELDSVQTQRGPRARLQVALERVAELSGSQDAMELIRCFVYIVSSLVHHERFGGLKNTQIDRLSKVAYGLLQDQGVKPQTSNLATLYSELHLALSQIHRRNGQHWQAAWEQQLSKQIAKPSLNQLDAVFVLGQANRAFRLGHADLAIDAFRHAEEKGDSRGVFEKARLGHIRALRIRGRVTEAFELARATRAKDAPGAKLDKELEWELFCCEAQATGNLAPMVTSVLREGTHFQASFVLEAQCWAWANPERRWTERLHRLRTLNRSGTLKLSRQGVFFDCVQCLEECKDPSLPIATRLRRLGLTLAHSSQIINIDREMLVWVGAARWLASARSSDLARLVLREYTATSLRLSEGETLDALGQARDLIERPWFRRQNDVESLDETKDLTLEAG